jgi:hypothetical protein
LPGERKKKHASTRLLSEFSGISRQLVEQHLGFLQDRRVEAFSEPAVDRGQQIAGVGALTLVLGRDSRPMRGDREEKALSEYQVYVAEHYASKDFLSDLKREITDSIRDLGRPIESISHPDRD